MVRGQQAGHNWAVAKIKKPADQRAAAEALYGHPHEARRSVCAGQYAPRPRTTAPRVFHKIMKSKAKDQFST